MSQEHNIHVKAVLSGDKVLLAISRASYEDLTAMLHAFRKVDGADDVALDQEYGSGMFYDRPTKPGTYTYRVEMMNSAGALLCEGETTLVYVRSNATCSADTKAEQNCQCASGKAECERRWRSEDQRALAFYFSEPRSSCNQRSRSN